MSRELESSVQEHALRIQAMEVQSIQQMEKMDNVISSVGDLTSTLKEYIVKHDSLKESQDRIWAQINSHSQEIKRIWQNQHSNQSTIDSVNPMGARLQKQCDQARKEISTLQSVDAANQPIIDGVRAMNAKLVWLVVAAMLSPLSIGAAMLFK